MQHSGRLTLTGFSAVLGLALALPAPGGGARAQTAIPTMTIKILNNSLDYNIYPVLSVGQGGTDQWIQAQFGVPSSLLGTNIFPRKYTYRMYIAPSGDGIPVGGSATITLPLYSQITPTIDPTQGGQLADWWQGGGIRIYRNPAIRRRPPAALVAEIGTRPDQKPLTFASGAAVPTCTTGGGASCKLVLVQDTSELPLGDPFQLMEYTLGAVDTTVAPYKLNTNNIDVDVSYVDSAFMPALVEPYPNSNKIWGWVGVNKSIPDFNAALAKFLADFPGWPRFIDGRGVATRKIPSPLNVFVGDEINPDQLNAPNARPDLTPLPWRPIQTLRDKYQACLLNPGSCSPQLASVDTLLAANYANYSALFADPTTGWDCTLLSAPVANTFNQQLGHLHGWSPYSTGCTSASANQLYQTPGYYNPGPPRDTTHYEAVKRKFDTLQLQAAFNPYVLFIHGPQYLNAPNVYAYSVDDAVGNLQVDQQSGFYLAVGSPAGLPNTNPAGPVVQAPFGYSSADKVRFVKYGVCTATPDTPVNPNFTSFVLPGDENIRNCGVSFIYNLGQSYFYKPTTLPPYASYPQQQFNIVDCAGNDANGLLWCGSVFGQSKVDDSTGRTINYLVAGAPPEPPPRR